MYFRFENGIHPRETGQDYVLALHNHTASLEDHVKLLIKRVNNLSQLPKSQQNNQPNYNYDDEFSKDLDSEKIIDKDENDSGGANNDALLNQIESELKSVALEWKTSSKVEECSCCSTFDAFNKKVDEIFF